MLHRYDDRTAHTIGSQVAAACSTLALFPLDTLRFRYMSQDATQLRRHNHGVRYTRVTEAARLIIRDEGAAALYRGATVAVSGAVVSWGLYFYLFKTMQGAASWQSSWGLHAGTSSLALFSRDTVCSTAASCSVALLTTPIWLVKTRMQVEDVTERGATSTRPRNYPNFVRGVQHVIRTDGVRALWRGVSSQLLMAVPNAVNIPLYEALKRSYLGWSQTGGSDSTEASRHGLGQQMSFTGVVLCSAVSKGAIAGLTNPLFVVRTRLQDARSRSVPGAEYTTMASVVAHMARSDEGLLRGLTKGLGVSLYLTVPRTCLYMVLLEQAVAALKKAPTSS